MIRLSARDDVLTELDPEMESLPRYACGVQRGVRLHDSVFVGETLDDLMRSAIEGLMSRGDEIKPSKGQAVELRGVTLKLTNIRARLSRTETRGKVFSSLGELCWYLAGSDELDFIGHYLSHYREYSSSDGKYSGAYGPRLFGDGNQIYRVTELLRSRPDSRRAVVQLFDAKDLDDPAAETPCTCTLQFMVREGSLELVTYMRSNDVIKGMAHDVFAFTMIQELVARSLDADVGSYTHFVGSLHLYTLDQRTARAFLDEGWQLTDSSMPDMPLGDPWEAVELLLNAEKSIRLGEDVSRVNRGEEPYWSDLIGLLLAWRSVKERDAEGLKVARASLRTDVFDVFVDERAARLELDGDSATDTYPSLGNV